MPTDEQAQACLRVCQMLSTGFQPIHLFRYGMETRACLWHSGAKVIGVEVETQSINSKGAGI